MVRTKQVVRGAVVKGCKGSKGSKLHMKALQVVAVRRWASVLGLKQMVPHQPEQTKNRQKVGTLSLMEIRHYQKSDGCLIHLFNFGQLVHEIVHDMAPALQLHIQAMAVVALQLGAEVYITGLIEDANLSAIHTKRIMIAPKDMWLAKRLRWNKVVGKNVESSAQLHGAQQGKNYYLLTCISSSLDLRGGANVYSGRLKQFRMQDIMNSAMYKDI